MEREFRLRNEMRMELNRRMLLERERLETEMLRKNQTRMMAMQGIGCGDQFSMLQGGGVDQFSRLGQGGGGDPFSMVQGVGGGSMMMDTFGLDRGRADMERRDRMMMGTSERGFGAAGDWEPGSRRERGFGAGAQGGLLGRPSAGMMDAPTRFGAAEPSGRFGIEPSGPAAFRTDPRGAFGMEQRRGQRKDMPPLLGARQLLQDERRLRERLPPPKKPQRQEAEEPSKPLPPIWDDALGDGSRSRRHARNFDPEALPLRKLFLSVRKTTTPYS
jgi:hypothetical protein